MLVFLGFLFVFFVCLFCLGVARGLVCQICFLDGGCHSLKSHVFGHEKQQPELNFGIDHIIAVWRSVLLRPCLSNLFLLWLP